MEQQFWQLLDAVDREVGWWQIFVVLTLVVMVFRFAYGCITGNTLGNKLDMVKRNLDKAISYSVSCERACEKARQRRSATVLAFRLKELKDSVRPCIQLEKPLTVSDVEKIAFMQAELLMFKKDLSPDVSFDNFYKELLLLESVSRSRSAAEDP
jgi:hypothetical protein